MSRAARGNGRFGSLAFGDSDAERSLISSSGDEAFVSWRVASTIRSAEKRDEMVSRAASDEPPRFGGIRKQARDRGCQRTRIKFIH